MARKLHLFEGYGVELEYMIVDRDSLNVKPICDHLFSKIAGEITSEIVRKPISWSNELVNHVVELKCFEPVDSLAGLGEYFHKQIMDVNRELESENACLMPTAMHPWMDPLTETRLWPHEYHEIYELYNRIFDCRGHGWSNLQSTHINLPFQGDEEFGRLHAAIRLLLPLIPALSAASPYYEGKHHGFKDGRLEAYRHNQEAIPSIAGAIIPEAVYTRAEYHTHIFDPIIRDIRPFDTNGILDKHFLNSRGAIARFDRGAIEIRIIDIQESPDMDIAILEIISEILKQFVSETWSGFKQQSVIDTGTLADLWKEVIKDGGSVVVSDEFYIKALGFEQPRTVKQIWFEWIVNHEEKLTSKSYYLLKEVIQNGSLSERMIREAG
ncbi:MAG: glutamate-cysteine ligase family protein, partial [Balneolaceae bacterium]